MIQVHEAALRMAWAVILNQPKPLVYHLYGHFGKQPDRFPVIRARFGECRLPDVTRAIEACALKKGRKTKTIGVASSDSEVSLRSVIHPDSSSQQVDGSIAYSELALPSNESFYYARRALCLIKDGRSRIALLISSEIQGFREYVYIEVISEKRSTAEAFILEFQDLMDKHSIYRGNSSELKTSGNGDFSVLFRQPKEVTRDQIVLPEALMHSLEEHAVHFSDHRDRMRDYGFHQRRGLLLFGPPGTGKSQTVSYLVSQLRKRTTLYLNGSNASLMDETFELARRLQPSTIVIDDFDLIAKNRTNHYAPEQLNQLLNQIDKIPDSDDVLLLVTTNNPEHVEPALSNRPGRIDFAVEIPLPDDECRKQLMEMCGRNLDLTRIDLGRLVARTSGASGAFILELFRKAALFALADSNGVLEDKHFDKALAALSGRGTLNRSFSPSLSS